MSPALSPPKEDDRAAPGNARIAHSRIVWGNAVSNVLFSSFSSLSVGFLDMRWFQPFHNLIAPLEKRRKHGIRHVERSRPGSYFNMGFVLPVKIRPARHEEIILPGHAMKERGLLRIVHRINGLDRVQ